ncbi:MAG: hypothetical protein ACJAUG_003692 [Halioglobus sp.]|jgi:hypothetical protein
MQMRVHRLFTYQIPIESALLMRAIKYSFDPLSVNLDGGTDNGSRSFAGFTGATLMFPLNKDGDHVAKVNDREIAATDIFQFVALSDVCL